MTGSQRTQLHTSAHRFFVSPEDVVEKDGQCVIQMRGDEAHHAMKVLRLGIGDTVTVLDGTGVQYEAVIASADASNSATATLTAEVVGKNRSSGESSVAITLIQSLPKGDKMGEIIQKGTEVGVARFRPVVSERVIVNYSGEQVKRRLGRWRKIAKEAAKQSGRGIIPEVEPPTSLGFALQAVIADGAGVVFFWEEATRPLWEAVAIVNDQLAHASTGPRMCRRHIAIVIGPEGGFSSEEVHTAETLGAVTASLGPRVLRTETAGTVATALVLYAAELENTEMGSE